MQVTRPAILSNSANPVADNRLREFAHHLAKIHEANAGLGLTQKTAKISRPQKADLLEHLNIWEQVLRNANAIFKAVPSNDLPISRAGEWMLDNFYVVKQTFRQIEENLPASFLKQLPKLDGMPLQGRPRIFALARGRMQLRKNLADLDAPYISKPYIFDLVQSPGGVCVNCFE